MAWHGVGVGAFGQHDEAFARVLLPRGELRAGAAAHLLHRGGHRHGVLHAAGHAGHAADGVGVALAEALAPEGVGGAFGQQRLADDAVDGEHAGVPAGGDERGLVVGTRRRVDGGEVFGDAGVGVEAVDGVEQCGQLRALLGQVLLGAAAQDQHVDLPGVAGQRVHAVHRHAGGERLQLRGRAAGVDADELHVGAAGDGGLDAAAQVAVAGNGDANGRCHGECWLRAGPGRPGHQWQAGARGAGGPLDYVRAGVGVRAGSRRRGRPGGRVGRWWTRLGP